MKIRSLESKKSPSADGGYSQAIEVTVSTRTLYISGQIPVDLDENVPDNFSDQARLVWQNIINQLNATDMTVSNIVKHTTYLSSREYRDGNSRIRQEMLGDHAPALTVIIADIYHEAWLLEIEAIAVA
ncbi:MAG: RidA family protein [Emcibacteraceae bacterium]|nr:RidA family protein [Emcibacteraceae bacterium]